ncbi:hypothetical protein DXT99_23935 [Pontibacter diazotrophicus]|uniref:Integrase catalytic domain-containing protein n=1 Tax=Pontibacter diazotrophicus TaxID=1400979 RepID=A0A3D8L345_9BACT|nr:hypothetical protein DXT99_23935 [Pontibacter diazotrophicus]
MQYACQEFRNELEDKSVRQSISRKGNCWDNAVAESFFKTMKAEMVYHESFLTVEEARMAVVVYIEVYGSLLQQGEEPFNARLSYPLPVWRTDPTKENGCLT